MPGRKLLFGVSLGDWSGADLAQTRGVHERAVLADESGLDLFTLADHP